MKNSITAALATAFALPIFAAGQIAPPAPPAAAPTPPPAPAPRAADPWKHFDFSKHFDFDFDFDFDMLLADAGDLSRKHAEFATQHAEQMAEWAKNFAADMQGSMAFMFGDRMSRGKVVKGAPYSAEVVTETRQTLADGNVISHRNANRVFRDGEGRTRQETYRGEKLRTIYISDPVSGTTTTLMPGTKVAVTIPRNDRYFEHIERRSTPRADTEKGKTSGESNDDRKKRVIVRRVEEGVPGSHEEVRVQVYRFADGGGREVEIVTPPPAPPAPPVPPVPPTPAIAPLPPVPPIPGVHTLRFENIGRLGKGVTTSLGTKDIEGVKAEGKSTQWTIPAGEIGNKNAIFITSESWYSPDLKVTVYSRYHDPRTGESIYRLAGLRRTEPAPDLFKVPDDYKQRGKGRSTGPDAKREAPEARRER
jgi:hypothetical protein